MYIYGVIRSEEVDERSSEEGEREMRKCVENKNLKLKPTKNVFRF